MTRMVFTIPDDMKRALEKRSNELGISQSAFIRMNLFKSLKGIIKHENKEKEKRK